MIIELKIKCQMWVNLLLLTQNQICSPARNKGKGQRTVGQ